MRGIDRHAAAVCASHLSAFLLLLLPRVVTRFAQRLQRSLEQNRIATVRLDMVRNRGGNDTIPDLHAQPAKRMLC
jgi:hypothetical protein